MDLDTKVLFAVVALIAINQVMMRLGALKGRLWFFWTIQLVNVVTGSLVLWYGLPGFEAVRPVSYVIALLFFFRTVQNTNGRALWLRERVVNKASTKREEILSSLYAEE